MQIGVSMSLSRLEPPGLEGLPCCQAMECEGLTRRRHFGNFESAPIALGADDFNRDGILDLAAGGGINAPADANNLSILLGDGKGGFAVPTYHTVGQAPQSMSIADFNGDGFSDIAVSNAFPLR